MFKKRLEVKPSSNIKSSEKRKLKEKINSRTNGLRIPDKLSKAIINSIEIKKGSLYFDSETKDPVFFELRDGDVIVPTLHELWASVKDDEPLGIPFILTHEAVIDRLTNGADLMIRGCHGPYCQGLKQGSIVAVVNYKNPNIAVAVGKCLMDLENKNDDDVPDSGIAVDIWTVIGDQLTSLGRSMDEVLVEAKEKTKIERENVVIEPKQEQASTEIDTEKFEQIVLDDTEEKLEEVTVLEINEEVETNTANQDDFYSDDDDYDNCDDDEYDLQPEEYVMTTEDIDDMFKRAVLYTISQDKLDLPIPASQFISAYILKNLPPVDNNIVNMKKTSWKKTAKFLKMMEKDSLIKTKGKDDKLTVISVMDRSNPRISEFVPYRTKAKPEMNDSNNNEQNGDISSLSNAVPPLIINSYLKPTNSSRLLFNRLDMVYDSYFTEKEVKDIIQKYIKKNSHVVNKSNPEFIEPDDVLNEFGKVKMIKRSDLATKIINSFSPYYVICKEGDNKSNDLLVNKRLVPKKGKIPTIDIKVESLKIGRRVVTRVANCETFFVDLDKLSNVLKIRCGGSCSVTDDPKLGRIVTVQGKHDRAVIDVLRCDWGVPSKYCIVDNKVKPRKRRPRTS